MIAREFFILPRLLENQLEIFSEQFELSNDAACGEQFNFTVEHRLKLGLHPLELLLQHEFDEVPIQKESVWFMEVEVCAKKCYYSGYLLIVHLITRNNY